ncbi:MAG: hypothetical protein KDJ89_14345 [Notoacmeibacter sp.]|nr:hypothetical protein [Notoacmeibacter sp.]
MRNRINTTRPGSGLLAACAAAFLAGLVSPAPAQAQNVGSAGQNWSSSWGFSSSADRSLRLQQAQVIRNAETTADPSTVVYNNNIYDYRSNYQEVNTGGDNTAAVDYQIGDNIGQNTNAVGSMNTGSKSALFQAGAKVVNRRDAKISIMETQWGIRNLRDQTPVNFFISGTINSLDFIPGGGASLEVGGVGPRYRQNRILIGLDLALTDSFTGQVLASIPLQKQIFSREIGLSAGRFFADTLVSLDVGGQQREAVHFVLRQMLNLGTFELLGLFVSEKTFAQCRADVAEFLGKDDGVPNGSRKEIRAAMANSARLVAETKAAMAAAANPQQPQQKQAAARPNPAQAELARIDKMAETASLLAAKSIALSEEAKGEKDEKARTKKAAQALSLVQQAGKLLREAAKAGLKGAKGDAVAIVVQRALEMAIEVNDLKPPEQLEEKPAPAAAQAAPEPAPAAPAPAPAPANDNADRANIPGTPEYQRARKLN